ncbi:putative nuclease HARBI1 [Sardina pilchardus]|uniref:putative nuclease HARBI1 n=1 Tax=Sardina pilchardus TaxID=27697 RepID=UPI002E15DBB9
MLKGRWRSLDASGGKLLYEPSKVCQIILACCVLHNISQSHGIEMREEEMRMDPGDHPPLPAEWDTHATALRRRRQLIHLLTQQDGLG